MRRILLAVTLLLTGCAGFNPFGPGPVDPEDATAKPDLVLTGAGVLKFQCSADKDGYWWRFIAPEVVLMNPAGRKIATQGADFNFTAPDKSKLSSKPFVSLRTPEIFPKNQPMAGFPLLHS